ncbi:vomeronasal type-2 receptor 116-like [Rana temporaria]|uniref:vomeronasal type-2 receptor 116-like n=1 Tax=Rana temporaria TaxID=8407 RepID=UPI001AAC5115|nr:vomeronasal type-2 receptor 116-like [Rana temporaria]
MAVSQQQAEGRNGISYGATDPLLTNKHLYPSFFQTLPSDQTQYLAIAKLLKHFGWTWIGVITSDDDGGERSIQELKKAASVYDICVEYIILITSEGSSQRQDPRNQNIFKTFKKSTSKIVVLCSISLLTISFIATACNGHHDKTFIIPAGPMVHYILVSNSKKMFDESLVFSPPTKNIPHLKRFLDNINTTNHPKDLLQEHILAMYFKCLTSNPSLNHEIESRYGITLHPCNSSVKISQLANYLYDTERFSIAYLVYKAVYAMAHSLHEMQLYISGHPENSYLDQSFIKKNFQYFLQRVRFHDPLGEQVYFNERGEMAAFYDIHYFAAVTNNRVQFKDFAVFNASLQEQEALVVSQAAYYWKRGMAVFTPVRQKHRHWELMSHDEQARIQERSDSEFSEVVVAAWFWSLRVKEEPENKGVKTYKTSCIKCPEDKWPNDKNRCVPKPVEFLSYDNDPSSIVVCAISALFFIKTSIILGMFIIYKDTPVIKANNQNLSILLLVSIMLSFLCILLFIGRPMPASCMAQHTSYGIIFSVAVSSILAKTVMIYMAFKAIKPRHSSGTFIGIKITKAIVFICPCIQILISLIWLCTSPPFPENNIHAYPGIIISQCNEGSMLAFSILLGYMGLLAALSFIMSFLSRNLPDSFNEAKYITFSMLVFCSVWIAFIPAYMSVTGKNTVLVEIFAIISSSVGVLGCIFIPKCYIIVIRPDLNVKQVLLRHAH